MTPGRRKMSLLVGLVIVAIWLAARVIPAAAGRFMDARWAIGERARLLAQSRRDIANEKILFDSAATIKQSMIDLAPKLLSGETAAQASDALTSLLGVIAERSNTKLTGSNPVDDSTMAGGLRRVAVHATLDGDIAGVTGLLQGLAQEATVLTTDDLQLLAADAAGTVTPTEVLRVELTVRGWYLAGRN
ncbi:MAG: type II secretion system protein GspM [Gemmatimonadota bacterium]